VRVDVFRKSRERVHNVVQIPIAVQVVRFDVKNGCETGLEIQEGAVKFARFDNKVWAAADSAAPA
jgi:hypothetical protein